MKKKIFVCTLVAFMFLMSFSVFAVSPSGSAAPAEKNIAAKADEVLKSRFLNMLNHNLAYGDDLESAEKLANCAADSIVSAQGGNDSSFLKETAVAGFVYNMYGVKIEDFSDINRGYPKSDGLFYVIPHGITKYTHRIISLTKNEDGSYTAVTHAAVTSHDSGDETVEVTTLFVRNTSSAFGFNIISSEISKSFI